jgi:hypothetical protein
VSWEVDLHADFVLEYRGLLKDVQDELSAHIELLEQIRPRLGLGRPRADTLKCSRHANMKELRFDAADGVWRGWPSRLTQTARPLIWQEVKVQKERERKERP